MNNKHSHDILFALSPSTLRSGLRAQGSGCAVRVLCAVSNMLLLFTLLLTGCGFHLQGEKILALPLHHLYLQTPDPYGQLARSLRQYLKMSHVELVSSPSYATTVLAILNDETSQELLSVSGTQQTRQYNLKVTVTFEISDPAGGTMTGPQTLSESRTITIQSNQVLGSSNETNLFYQQMRRTLAYSIVDRLASSEISRMLFSTTQHHTTPSNKSGD